MQTFSSYLEKRTSKTQQMDEGRFGDFMNTLTGGYFQGLGQTIGDVGRVIGQDWSKRQSEKQVQGAGTQIIQNLTTTQQNLATASQQGFTAIQDAIKKVEEAQAKAIEDIKNIKASGQSTEMLIGPEETKFLQDIQARFAKNKEAINKEIAQAQKSLGFANEMMGFGTENLKKLISHAASKIAASRRIMPGQQTDYQAPDFAKWQQQRWQAKGSQAAKEAAARRKAEKPQAPAPNTAAG